MIPRGGSKMKCHTLVESIMRNNMQSSLRPASWYSDRYAKPWKTREYLECILMDGRKFTNGILGVLQISKDQKTGHVNVTIRQDNVYSDGYSHHFDVKGKWSPIGEFIRMNYKETKTIECIGSESEYLFYNIEPDAIAELKLKR